MNKLTVVGLPIGNIEDITIRSFKALFSADLIIAEDTRNYLKIKSILKERFAKLFVEFELNPEVRPELISYTEQKHDSSFNRIAELIESHNNPVLISDAGMPLISDPGFRLIRDLLKHGKEIDVIPGPTAIEPSLILSGLPTDRFAFIGFLPREKGKIKKIISAYDLEETTVLFYESPFRVIKTLEIIRELFPEATVACCNDLTKKFQKVIRGSAENVIEELKKGKIVGEWTLVMRSTKF